MLACRRSFFIRCLHTHRLNGDEKLQLSKKCLEQKSTGPHGSYIARNKKLKYSLANSSSGAAPSFSSFSFTNESINFEGNRDPFSSFEISIRNQASNPNYESTTLNNILINRKSSLSDINLLFLPSQKSRGQQMVDRKEESSNVETCAILLSSFVLFIPFL
mmetsp:Transcript_23062/g.26527  ORF Transcript_23062/g.26527 Transcript_23062/m.26527 type:complete len:161 (+) Transcript_23062:87-569(+)